MRTKIIAEIGANHGGNLELAKQMIAAAANAGCDIVKFQSWQAQRLKPGDPNFERHSKAQLSDEAHHELMACCAAHGVEFLTTCFDWQPFLASPVFAHQGGEPDAASYKMACCKDFEHVIISTGMTSEPERRGPLCDPRNVTLLHCVSCTRRPAIW